MTVTSTVLRALLACILLGCVPEGPGLDALGLDDGFVLGVNLPWRGYGHDFGDNAWGHDGASTDPEGVENELRSVRTAGAPVVRWFVLGDGRAGLEFDGDMVVGVQDTLLADFDAALDAAEAADVFLVPVLLDYLFCSDAREVDGATLGGHAAVVTDPARREAFSAGVARPLFDRYGSESRIFAWDLMNEPGWLVDENGSGWLQGGVPRHDLTEFLAELADAAHDLAEQPVTLGASRFSRLNQYWSELPLDLWQAHLYAPEVLPPRAAALGLPGPVVVGELSSADPGMVSVLDAALAGGYLGAWPWSLRAGDDASALDLEVLAGWADRNRSALAR